MDDRRRPRIGRRRAPPLRSLDELADVAAKCRYRPRHRPEAQRCVDGVPIDPHLRPYFDCTPNDRRPRSEIADWWNRAYVCSESESRFSVYCLDGGAWDRATWRGAFETMAEAVSHAGRLTREPPNYWATVIDLREPERP